MKYTAKERFLKYVQIDTEADPYSDTSPSTEKQKDLTKIVLQELHDMGVKAESNEYGYIYASIPANVDYPTKTVFFCSHLDTTPDASGKNVKPIVHADYQGQDIVLPDDPTQIISPEKYPYLKQKIGTDIITASGKTLLGADDKSGVAEIMDAVYQLVNNPDIKHGDIKVLFTTDEEIGKGVVHVDVDKVGADFGYTLDGGELGTFQHENFSADAARITITGVPAHPCCAKGKMESAIKIAADIIAALPKDKLSPETTVQREGFIHPTNMETKMESGFIDFILRDFDTANLSLHAQKLEAICEEVMKGYPFASYELTITEQYRNMREILDDHPYITDIAIQAMKNIDLECTPGLIRGGTDGAVLSYKGLPCPNLFTGMQAIHSRHEWISVYDMERAVDTILEIVKIIGSKEA